MRHNPPRRMNLRYTEDQAGLPIKDEDVIRAEDGMSYTMEEINRFHEKSGDRCPTYGNCDLCYSVGPIGDICDKHGPGGTYKYYIMRWGNYPRPMIDAHYFASLMEAPGPPVVPSADRMFQWLSTPMQTFNGTALEVYINMRQMRDAPAAERWARITHIRDCLDHCHRVN